MDSTGNITARMATAGYAFGERAAALYVLVAPAVHRTMVTVFISWWALLVVSHLVAIAMAFIRYGSDSLARVSPSPYTYASDGSQRPEKPLKSAEKSLLKRESRRRASAPAGATAASLVAEERAGRDRAPAVRHFATHGSDTSAATTSAESASDDRTQANATAISSAPPVDNTVATLTLRSLPGVSILKPMKGVDCSLHENLSAFFRLQYPRFEIIMSVADPNDPAIAVAESMMKLYPDVDARLVIGAVEVGVNPKINNLVRGYRLAKYDAVWISDSNVTVDRFALVRSVLLLQKPRVGLVHQLPVGIAPRDFGAELETLYFGTSHARMYLFINFVLSLLGVSVCCVMGKSMLFRRSDLDLCGGIEYFGRYLAEDNMIGQALCDIGLRCELSDDIIAQPMGTLNTVEYALRRVRWIRLRKYIVPGATYVEPFTESLICGLMASYGFCYLWGIHPLNFLAFHFIAWFVFDITLFQALVQKPVDNMRGFLIAWVVRELSYLPLYFYGMAGNSVKWRGTVYILQSDGTVEPYRAKENEAYDEHHDVRWAHSLLESLRDQPWIIYMFSTAFFIIRIFAEILYRSHRNGNPVSASSSSSSNSNANSSANLNSNSNSNSNASSNSNSTLSSSSLSSTSSSSVSLNTYKGSVSESLSSSASISPSLFPSSSSSPSYSFSPFSSTPTPFSSSSSSAVPSLSQSPVLAAADTVSVTTTVGAEAAKAMEAGSPAMEISGGGVVLDDDSQRFANLPPPLVIVKEASADTTATSSHHSSSSSSCDITSSSPSPSPSNSSSFVKYFAASSGDKISQTNAETEADQPALSLVGIWNAVWVGVTMHLQNERNDYIKRSVQRGRSRVRS